MNSHCSSKFDDYGVFFHLEERDQIKYSQGNHSDLQTCLFFFGPSCEILILSKSLFIQMAWLKDMRIRKALKKILIPGGTRPNQSFYFKLCLRVLGFSIFGSCNIADSQQVLTGKKIF